MAQKALHHFSRLTVFLLETAGILTVLTFIAWVGLLMRLSHGPLNIDFLSGYIQKSMDEQQKDFVFSAGTTQLVWGGRFEPFELQLNDVQINRRDGTPVLAVDRVGVQLSKRHLLFARFVPRAITIHGPALRVIRQEDGHFALNLSAASQDQEAQPAPEPKPGQPNLIANLLLKLQERQIPLLGGLNKVSITDAIVSYEDRMLHASWKAHRSDVSFTRGKQGISSEAHMTIELDDKHTAVVGVQAYYDWDTRITNLLAAFDGLIPALAVQGSESLKGASEVNVPLKGSLAIGFDADFRPGMTRFAVNAGPGTFNAAGLYVTPIPVKSAVVSGYVNLKTHEGMLERARVDLDGPVAEARAQSTLEHGFNVVRAQATLSDMPIDGLKSFWPDKLTPDPRAWVTGHLSKGMASKATLDLALSIDDRTPEHKISVDKAEGQIDFTGIKVDYFPPLLPVLGVDGTANYDKSSFNLDLKSGKLGNMTVKKSAIHITGLDTQDDTHHSKIDVAVSLQGPLKTALEVLDSKPLGYPKELGLQTAEVGGSADIDVGFKFPLYGALQVKEVQVAAKAKLDDVSLKGLVSDYTLTGGPMDVSVTNGSMKVKGAGKLGAMPVKFDWLKNFAHDAVQTSKLTASLPLDAAALVKFGVPEDMNAGGDMASDVVYESTSDGAATLNLKGDLTRTSFEVAFAGFKKVAGIPGSLALTVHMKNGKADKITGLSLQTEKTAVKGDLTFDAKGVESAAFGQVVLGNTNAALTVRKKGEAGYEVNVSGRQLDLSKVLSGDSKPNTNADAAKKVTPIAVTLGVSRVITGKDSFLDAPKIYMRRNEWQRIEQLELDGKAGGGAVTLRYEPFEGGHSLNMQAENAGAALAALGVTRGVRGGKLSVTGRPASANGPRDMAGDAILTNFTLVDAPVLAKLLNALSLGGIIDLLNGKGISFSKARATFVLTDRGQPATDKNVRDIKITHGETSGASLGLTYEGHIDEWGNTYDLNGTIVPVSDLNKLLSSIPLIGNLLTANGEGIFAATYSIKGPKDQPSVTVNPLAVLAPGMLRKLFFEQ